MQPAPLAGSETVNLEQSSLPFSDATRAPRGVGNAALATPELGTVRMQPAPLAGSETAPPDTCGRSHTMQPAPLAGSETNVFNSSSEKSRCNPRPSRGRKLTDGVLFVDVPRCNPRPSRGRKLYRLENQFSAPNDATRAPRRVGNAEMMWSRMSNGDATRAPRGVGNVHYSENSHWYGGCNPRPSRGRKLDKTVIFVDSLGCNPRPRGVGNVCMDVE